MEAEVAADGDAWVIGAAERALAQMDALMKAGAERLPVVESRCRPAASK